MGAVWVACADGWRRRLRDADMEDFHPSLAGWSKVCPALNVVFLTQPNLDLIFLAASQAFSSLGKNDLSPSDPVDRGEKHWPFLFF